MNNVSFAGRETMLTKSPLVKKAEDKLHQYLSPGHIFSTKEIEEAKAIADKASLATAKKVQTTAPEAIYTSGRIPTGTVKPEAEEIKHIDIFG